MPIVRIQNRIVYYAHIPKCAGSSVENYLAERFGRLAFLDRDYRKIQSEERWNNTSPQHIDADSLRRLFPEEFFDHTFAVVRHPAMRLRSAFTHNLRRRCVPWRTSFEDWLKAIEEGGKREQQRLDNHTRPMSDMVLETTVAFKIEDGLDDLVEWLDALCGNADEPREIGRSNVGGGDSGSKSIFMRGIKMGVQPPTPGLDEHLCRAVYRIYKEDYEKFGYDIYDPLDASK